MNTFILYIIILCPLFIFIISIFQIKKEIINIKDTLNKISNELNISMPSAKIFDDEEFNCLILQNNKIKAIKRYRKLTNSTLSEANHFVDNLLNNK